MTTERSTLHWTGPAYAVLALAAVPWIVVALVGGAWFDAGKGVAMAGIFAVAALVQLRWEGRWTPVAEVLSLLFLVALVTLLFLDNG